jgi:hypothetical protein
VLVVAGLAPLVAAAVVLALVRNNRATESGVVNRI